MQDIWLQLALTLSQICSTFSSNSANFVFEPELSGYELKVDCLDELDLVIGFSE